MAFVKRKKALNLVGFLFIFCAFFPSYSESAKKSLILLPEKTQPSSPSSFIDKNHLSYQAELAYLKAESDFLNKNIAEGLQHLKTALIFDPKSLPLRERLADTYKEEGLLTEALFIYRQLQEEFQDQPRLNKKMMDCYALNELHQPALKHNLYLIEKDPSDLLLSIQKAVLLMKKEDWTESLKTLQSLESQDSSVLIKAQAILLEAYIFAVQGRQQLAIKKSDQLLEFSVYDQELALQISSFYKTIGQREKAITYLQNFQQEYGPSKAVSSILFDELSQLGDYKQAYNYIQQLESLGSMDEQHYFYSAIYLMEHKRYRLAIPYLKDLTHINPSHGYYYYLLALSYRKSDKTEEALQAYRRVPASSPHFLLSQLELVDLWQKQGNYKDSFSLLERLSFEGSVSVPAVSIYSQSLWKAGQMKKAIEVLNKALEQKPMSKELLKLRNSYSNQAL